MRVLSGKTAVVAACGMIGIAVFLSAAPTRTKLQESAPTAREVILVLNPAQTKVHYSVDSSLHAVHGTFNLKSGRVHFDPESGRAGGEVVVYATSGDSGNSSRDARMHKEILETQKYPDATFRPTQVEGRVALSGASDVKLRGMILLHGSEHEIDVPVHAEIAGDHWTGQTRFEVPYIEWGIKNPSNWLLKVKPVVKVELEMAGTAKGPS
jgi:polyisoprenoid-binding protein YceI